MSKWLAKHISTNVSFKITTRKRHIYIKFGGPWIWNQCFYLGIWNDVRNEMILLRWFQLATRSISQNKNETEFYNALWYINFLWIFEFPIGIIEISTSSKWCFWRYFSSLHDYWPPSTCNSLVHNSWGEMEWCEKTALQLLKMRKKKISWNIITKCVTDLLLTVRSSSMKDYTCHNVVST